VERYCENGNEPVGSIKCCEVLGSKMTHCGRKAVSLYLGSG
jgi:hypothetical protein